MTNNDTTTATDTATTFDNWENGWNAKNTGTVAADAVVDAHFAAGFNARVLHFSRDDYRETAASVVAGFGARADFISIRFSETARRNVVDMPRGF